MSAVGMMVLSGIGAVLVGLYIRRKNRMLERTLRSFSKFTATHLFIGCDFNTGFAIDESSKQLCFAQYKGGKVLYWLIAPSDIVSVEILEDGKPLVKYARSSPFESTAIGGLLLGGVVSVIDELLWQPNKENDVNRITLRVIINNTSAPFHYIAFMDTNETRGNTAHKQALEDIRHWYGMLETLMRHADAEHKQAIQAGNVHPVSTAEEIKKLAELHEAGYLTMDEFQEQKKRILLPVAEE